MKVDKLIEKTTESGESKKWKVIVGIAVGIGFSVLLFTGLMFVSGIDDYLQDNKQIVKLYDFYDLNNHGNGTSVYVIGSSQTGNGIYAPKINQILNDSNLDVHVYNLYASSDTPNQRLAELQYIIDNNPSLVVYCISYRDFFNFSAYDASYSDERFKLVHNRIKLHNGSETYFSSQIYEDIVTPPSPFYYKKFIMNSMKYSMSSNVVTPTNYSYDIYGGLDSRIANNKPVLDNDTIELQITHHMGYWESIVDVESDNRKAFDYIINTLNNEGIPVIIVNMPIHPYLSESISDESRNNFQKIMDVYGDLYYDYEHQFAEYKYFSDSYHLSYIGTLEFSPIIADIIIQEMS